MSKLLLRLLSMQNRTVRIKNDGADWRPGNRIPVSTYLPPPEILRTVRDYHGEVQELAHLWSFVINFNALASLVKPAPRKITMAELRPGATLLEPDMTGQHGQTSGSHAHGESALLTEELCVSRSEDDNPAAWLRVVHSAVVDQQTAGTVPGGSSSTTTKEREGVSLHDIVNQPVLTAGLTSPHAKGIDGWAIVQHTAGMPSGKNGSAGGKENVVVLFQTKGKEAGPAVGKEGVDSVLRRQKLNAYIENLMSSAFEAADKHVLDSIRKFKQLPGAHRHMLVCVYEYEYEHEHEHEHEYEYGFGHEYECERECVNVCVCLCAFLVMLEVPVARACGSTRPSLFFWLCVVDS